MGEPQDSLSLQEQRLGRAIAEYLHRIECGELVERKAFITEHSEVAELLKEYFECAEEIDQLISHPIQAHGPPIRQFPCPLGGYVLLSEIARGGRGVVYKARQSGLGRIVALKMILEGQLASPVDVERFHHEAQTAAKLHHANIVAIHEVGVHEDQHFFAMEYVDGQSLAELVREHPLPACRAASYVQTVAGAIEHAHQQGTLHRDLKPSNVLIDQDDHIKVTDFGFAKQIDMDSDYTLTGQVVGTPAYMPPEQAIGKHGDLCCASDVYSLGAILYELLTGRPPFQAASTYDTLREVIEHDPVSPRAINPSVPQELNTICLKCLAKTPAKRYLSARDLADDLERYLNDKPIKARPPSVSGRVWRWSRRNRGWAVSIVTLIGGFVAVAVGAVMFANLQTNAARKLELEVQKTQISKMILRISSERQGKRLKGWSARIRSGIRKFNRLHRDHESLQEHAYLPGICEGLDANLGNEFTGAVNIAFTADGKKVLLGEVDAQSGDRTPSRLCTLETNDVEPFRLLDDGPVGFLSNGTPWQLVHSKNGNELALIDLRTANNLQQFNCPKGTTLVTSVAVAATVDGSYVSCLAHEEDGGYVHLVWAINSSKAIAKIPTLLGQEDLRASVVVALSADGKLLAQGLANGDVFVWLVSSEKLLGTPLREGRNKIKCLCFTRDLLRVVEEKQDSELDGWLLAAGDAGGNIVIWDVSKGSVRERIRDATQQQVHAVAFSPDGMILVSIGSSRPVLWNMANGKPLLELDLGDNAQGLAFSADGRKLAIADSERVRIWNLENGRGITTLSGMQGQVIKICLSRDEKLLAALTHLWQVGIWNIETGHLLWVLEVPKGYTADNAALAFSPDRRKLAFSSGDLAMLWNLENGTTTNAWQLPQGLVNLLAFPSEDRLLLFRVETEDGKQIPLINGPFQQYPRVCRIRNLLDENPIAPIATIQDFNRGVFAAEAPIDGRYFAIGGIGGEQGNECSFRLFSPTGALLKELYKKDAAEPSQLVIDAKGTILAKAKFGRKTNVVHLPSGQYTHTIKKSPFCIGPDGKYYVIRGSLADSYHGSSLYRQNSDLPLVSFGIDQMSPMCGNFTRDGKFLILGNHDGTVSVCNLPRIEERLREIGIWPDDITESNGPDK